MLKSKKIILVLVALIVAGGILYSQSGMLTRNQLDRQVNSMIQRKDYQKMKKLSVNKSTYVFLKKLSADTKVSNTSDSQGGSDTLQYYVTSIGDKNVSVYMKKVSKISWRVNSIELQ
ncbi:MULTISPECIES: hypothetical protein [Lactiplantibacillus]|uniref:hypothetical protein n=1 Tax=Lactiplantibacillus TaxID=2767842 RepID=UPI0009776BA6|nr:MULTISPECIES: hypothetical protein [Lactiplantibacillus]MDL2063467.1 hypothetical protein [Lactiplantibacillus paraplantarum]PKX58724.1 hypothetical protein CUR48_08960 [Lactiplantibacillus plantarum]